MKRLKYLLINIFGVLILAMTHAGIRDGVLYMPGYKGSSGSHIELAKGPFSFWAGAAFLYFLGLYVLASGAGSFVLDISSDTSENHSNGDGNNLNMSLFIIVIIVEIIVSLIVGVFWM